MQKKNIEIGITIEYEPYENVIAKCLNGILKTEYKTSISFVGQKDANREFNYGIWLFNTDRPQLSCNMMILKKRVMK